MTHSPEPIEQAVILLDAEATMAALSEVNGGTFLAYVLQNVARVGVNVLLVLAMGKVDAGLSAFEGRRVGEARCRVMTAPGTMGSAAALRHIAAELADAFYVVPGACLFDFDLNALSLTSDCLAAMATRKAVAGRSTSQPPTGRSADVKTGAGFAEPGTDDRRIDTGYYAVARDALFLAGDRAASLEHDVIPEIAASGRLRRVASEGYFIDIGEDGAPGKARRELRDALRRPAVFFDRDGVLNHDTGYTHRPEDLRLIDGAVETIRRCNRARRYVFVVTNQSGVARGLYTMEAVRTFHAAMQRELRRAGAHIDGLYICPHHPDGTVDAYRQDCACRKPAPGMLRQALEEWPVDIAASVMIGDRPSDMQAAAACGIAGFQFGGGNLERFCEQHGVI